MALKQRAHDFCSHTVHAEQVSSLTPKPVCASMTLMPKLKNAISLGCEVFVDTIKSMEEDPKALASF